MVRKLALALAAPLLLVAAACADEADQQVLTGDAAVAALRAAPDAAAAAGSGRFEMTMAFDAPDGSMEITAAGVFTGDQMSMEMDFGDSLAALAGGAGEELPPGFDEPMQMVVDGDTAYMRMPMLDALTGSGGWLSLTPEDLGQATGSMGLGAGTSDPSQMLETLRGVADDVEEVGTEEVRGVETTHLRATVDIDKALAEVPAEQREQLQRQLESLDMGDAGIPVDVWVDGDSLVRRMTMDLGQLLGPAMGAEGGSASMTIEFFDYGADVSVEVPDASEVTPFSEALGGLGGGG
jgi:hypothetical protein